MLKKIYMKNGIIFISNENNMEINYNIVNNYNKNDKNNNNIINNAKKEYYKKYGCKYN